MNDPLEEALHRMKPAEMPRDLMARLTAARPQPADAAAAKPSGWVASLRRWLMPLAIGGTAAVATFLALRSTDGGGGVVDDSRPKITQRQALPYERNDYLVSARDAGVVVSPEQKPYRMVEVEWLEQDTVRPQAGGPAVRVETKRRGVIPVALDVF